MIVSRKYDTTWYNLNCNRSRLSGPYWGEVYSVNWYSHRLYGRSYPIYWNLNQKALTSLKIP